MANTSLITSVHWLLRPLVWLGVRDTPWLLPPPPRLAKSSTYWLRCGEQIISNDASLPGLGRPVHPRPVTESSARRFRRRRRIKMRKSSSLLVGDAPSCQCGVGSARYARPPIVDAKPPLPRHPRNSSEAATARPRPNRILRSLPTCRVLQYSPDLLCSLSVPPQG